MTIPQSPNSPRAVFPVDSPHTLFPADSPHTVIAGADPDVDSAHRHIPQVQFFALSPIGSDDDVSITSSNFFACEAPQSRDLETPPQHVQLTEFLFEQSVPDITDDGAEGGKKGEDHRLLTHYYSFEDLDVDVLEEFGFGDEGQDGDQDGDQGVDQNGDQNGIDSRRTVAELIRVWENRSRKRTSVAPAVRLVAPALTATSDFRESSSGDCQSGDLNCWLIIAFGMLAVPALFVVAMVIDVFVCAVMIRGVFKMRLAFSSAQPHQSIVISDRGGSEDADGEGLDILGGFERRTFA